MSKPAAKRLLDLIKRKRLKNKFTKLLPVGKFGGNVKKAVGATASTPIPDLALTCLIQVDRQRTAGSWEIIFKFSFLIPRFLHVTLSK